MAEVQKKASEGSLFGMEQPPIQAQAATGGSPDIAIPKRRANPDVFARAAGSDSATRFTTATAPAGCTFRTANTICRTAANTTRTIYYCRTTSATGPATGSSTTARNPIPSTGTDTTGTDGRKAMDATGLDTVCTGAGAARTHEEREYLRQPQEAAMYNFDKDCEDDRELLREDPYAEYPDFPKECRMTDMAQMDMVYC